MRWGWRTFMVLAVAVVTATTGGGGAGAATARKGSRLTVSKPCTYLSAKQVQSAFGGPVTIDPTNRGGNTLVAEGCSYLVGSAGQPTGVLVALILFPYFQPPGQTAVDVVEGQRATTTLSGLTVVDAKVGKAGYVNLDQSTIAVVASNKFAFSLQWLATGGPSTGGRLDAKTRKQLTTLAKQVVSRGPK